MTPSTPAPLRRIPNKPEQVRTNLNKSEHRQAPRPDREPPGSPPNTQKKANPEHRRHPLKTSHSPPSFPRPPSRHSCAGRNPPSHLPSPNSSLPPLRGEVRWGVGGNERLPTARLTPRSPTPSAPLRHTRAPSRHSCAPSRHSCAPSRHSCAGRNPPPLPSPFPNSSLPP